MVVSQGDHQDGFSFSPFINILILDKQQTIIIQGGGDGLWVGRGRGGRAEKNICYRRDHYFDNRTGKKREG